MRNFTIFNVYIHARVACEKKSSPNHLTFPSPMSFAARRRRSSVLYISDALVNPHAGGRCRRGSVVGGAGCALRTLPDVASASSGLPNGAGRRRRSSAIAAGVIAAHGPSITGGVANGAFTAPETPPADLIEEEEEGEEETRHNNNNNAS